MSKKCWLCGNEFSEKILTKLKTPVEKLNLSKRALSCLDRHFIQTIEEILILSEKDLLAIRYLGIRTLNEIKSKLKKHYLIDNENNSSYN